MTTQYLKQSIPQPREAVGEAVRTTLLDNDEVLVVENSYPPGASSLAHTHRFPSVAYVVEGGMLEARASDGTIERYDMRPGETLWSGAPHAHAARNAGPTPVRVVEVEIKHATPKDAASQKTCRVLTPATLEWRPDSQDPRRSAALLVGDTTRPGPFTIRYRLPAGYQLKLHLHPDEDEQLTVLSGAIGWSAGEAGSGAQEYTLTAGSFTMTPAGTPHRIWAMEDCEVQMSAIGPHVYTYVNGS